MDADIDAPEAWDISTSASNIIVAVIDTGIRRTHEDLSANIWTNATGYGWNALVTNGIPADDEGHGSLVSGILGAVGNNGKALLEWRGACRSWHARVSTPQKTAMTPTSSNALSSRGRMVRTSST